MITRLITRDSLKRLIFNILPNFQVIAPVSGEKISLFKRISAYEEIDWSERYITRPAKEFLFPAAEDLFQFRIKNKEVLLSEPSSHHGQKIILGIKPCDAAGLKILDQVLLHDGIDLPYISLRENTLLIGQLCQEPGKYCFCTSVGIHPHDYHNMDLMLADLGEDQILVQVVSRKGEEFISYFPGFFKDADSTTCHTPGQSKEISSYLKGGRLFDAQIVKDWLDKNFENPIWSKISTQCLGCGACTFFCPTCYCFDIADESIIYREESYQGVRRRVWNSCSFGHSSQISSYLPVSCKDLKFRQRVMHKFTYFVDRFQQPACVGCGRCRHLCPVGIDILQVLEAIQTMHSHSHEVKQV